MKKKRWRWKRIFEKNRWLYFIWKIGQGTFSKVTRAFHIITELIVALKILDKQKIEDEIDIERIIREIEILRSISHPNIS